MEDVPRRIFQTWETDEVPAQWKEAQASVIASNPDFEYVLITDADRYRILQQHFPFLIPVMRNFPHAVQRADLIRYVVMYVYGGVYLDLDYVCLRPIGSLVRTLPPDCEVGLVWSTNRSNYVSNSVLVSRPKADFWLHVITAACQPAPWWAVTRHAMVFATTGPMMLNSVRSRYRCPERVCVIENVVVPCSVCDLSHCASGKDPFYLLPIVGKSWHGWDSTLLDWLYCHYPLLLFVLLLTCVLLCRHFHSI